MRYQYGPSRQYEPIDIAQKAGGFKIATTVRRLVEIVDKFGGQEESLTWCPRAIELNAMFWTPPIRIAGKLTRIPISMRYDMLLGFRSGVEEAVPGIGAFPNGIYIVDHKTASSISSDLLIGYGVEYQFLCYGTGYIESGLEDIYGKLNGFSVQIIAKRPETVTSKNLVRGKIPMAKQGLATFYKDELLPDAISMYTRLTSPDREDKDNWPQVRKLCKGQYGLCDYFELCEKGLNIAEFNYKQHDEFKCLPESLSEPTKTSNKESTLLPLLGDKAAAFIDVGKAEKASKKAGQKSAASEKATKVLTAYVDMMWAAITNVSPGWEAFHQANFIRPGLTKAKIEKAIVDQWKKTFVPHEGSDYRIPVPTPDGQIDLSIKKNGLCGTISVDEANVAVTISWKMIGAEVITRLFDSRNPIVG
jgi:hypothetical protein